MNPFTAQPTSLRDPAAVWALREVLGDDHLAHVAASTFATWPAFSQAPPEQLVAMFGHRNIDVPAQAPPAPVLPAAIAMLSRYQLDFPKRLRESAAPPALLFVAGTLPDEPMLAVVGADNPTVAGNEIARSAGLAAAAEHVPVIVTLRRGCSLLAARTTLDAGGRVVIVMGHGFGVTSSHQLLLEEVVATGGAVVTTANPGVTGSSSRDIVADELTVTAADAVVLAEVGLHVAAAAPAARATVAANRFIIVPAPPDAAVSGRYVPATAFGSTLFANSREWTPDAFGTNPRIEQRTLNGLAPADAVVSNYPELLAAVRTACGQPPA